MGVTTATAAAIASGAAAVGYAAGHFFAPRAAAATNEQSGAAASVSVDSSDDGMYLAKGGWKKKKPVDPNAPAVTGNATKGAALFKAKCATCHSCLEGGPTKQGPNLYGIMGKEAGKSSGFKFTKNILSAGITWHEEPMDKWLENPKLMVMGTSMAFPGFKKETDRADVIAYLKEISVGYVPPPAEPQGAAE